MKRIIQLYENFVNESMMFNDSMGRPSKISKEILEIVKKAFPSNILSMVEEVEPNGLYQMSSPPTISNKGQSIGENEYKTITLLFHREKSKKVGGLTIGLRKRTSGPGTGYLAISGTDQKRHVLLDNKVGKNYSVAIEFYTNPEERLKELFNKEIKKYF